VRAAIGRWGLWSQIGCATVGALCLVFVQGCADIWGFDDLKLAPDAAADATGGSGGDDGGSTTCQQTAGTILSCGGCNQACDTIQSDVMTCRDSTCIYRDCASGWQDCDKTPPDTNGCETSTTSTLACGACGRACDIAHSIGATCVTSADGGIACQYSGCQPGWANCNPSAPDTDGCETSLATAANCGACGKACDSTSSQGASCADGKTCSYTGCKAGYADCDTAPPDTNGCETMTAATACEACGSTCDTVHSDGASCDVDAGPTCRYTGCAPGFKNCNATPPDTNGCETSLATLTNCGDCGRACDAMTSTGASCSGGNCTYGGCVPGFANCDTTPPDTNGCESSLSSTATCGACKNAACNTKTGAASCNGATCFYKCNAGLSDCNAATAPDTDGCECATPGCCGGSCQTTHSNGMGQSFYDCNALGGHGMAQAQAACEAFAGAGKCSASTVCCGGLSALGVCLGTTDSSMCGAARGQCGCWQYSGTAVGTVQSPAGKCTAACGATSDPAWN
jgi:hypothetical protein